MKKGKKIVELCTSRVYDITTHSFIKGFNEKLRQKDVQLLVHALNADIYWEEDKQSPDMEIFDHIPYDVVDVLVIMDEKIKSHTVTQKIIAEAKEKEIPVVVIDGTYEGTIGIRFDFAKGFEAVMRHIVEEHGIRDLHFMAGYKGNCFSEERMEVFENVLQENGIPFDKETMVSYGDFWGNPSRKATHKLIDEGRVPRALICANDIMAINVSDVLMKAGYRIPQDVVVTGFDGYDEAYISTPGITTVECNVKSQAETAASVVLSLLRGETIDAGECKVQPYLVKNESCGCPRCKELANKILVERLNTTFYRLQDDSMLIHDTIGRMMTAENIDKAVSCIPRDFAKNMFCVTKKECRRMDKNFFLEKTSGDAFDLVYDWGTEEMKIQDFDRLEICPRFEEICTGYPIIYQTLDYMGKFEGYVGYYFDSYDITAYSRAPGITEMIGAGIGGCINMCYQKYLLAKVEKMYKVDALTGLYNRLAFLTEFDKLKNDPVNEGITLTVLMADLDHLKKINDGLGHEAGDKAIAAMAMAVKDNCPENALCVRFGGDELLAFIPGECDTTIILQNIDRELVEVSEKYGFEVSASLGSYETKLSAELNFEDAVKHADEKMYAVKVKRRSQRV